MVWFCIKDVSSRLSGRLDCPGKFKDAIIRQKHIHLISTPTLNQEAIANFMENGRYENHLRKLRHELHSNSLHLAQAITDYFPEDTKIITPQGGFMLWVELNKRLIPRSYITKRCNIRSALLPDACLLCTTSTETVCA